MTLSASVPLVIVFLTGAAFLSPRLSFGRPWPWARLVLAVGSAAASLWVTAILWGRERVKGTGSFDGDRFSLFLGALVLSALAIAVFVTATRSKTETGRLFFAAAALLLVISTRDLLWIHLGIGALTWIVLELGALSWTILAFAAGLAGIGLIYWAGGGTDMAVIAASNAGESAVGAFGLTLILASLLVSWARIHFRAWRDGEGSLAAGAFLSLGSLVAAGSVAARIAAWLLNLSEVWAPFFWGTTFLAFAAGGLGLLLAGRLRSVLAWLSLSQAGYVGLAVLSGVDGRAPMLAHLAVATAFVLSVALAVDLRGGGAIKGLDELRETPVPGAVRWVLVLSLLSLASLPPLPGFVVKLPLFGAVLGEGYPNAFAAGMAFTFVIGIGCMRMMSRFWVAAPAAAASSDQRAPSRLALAMVLGAIVALGAFPDRFLAIAARAAQGLF